MAETLPTIVCPNCKHKSVKRVPRPKKCPKCGKKYKYEDNHESE